MAALSENVPPENENRIPKSTDFLNKSPNLVNKNVLMHKKKSPLPLERKLSKRKFSEEGMEISFGNIYDNDEGFDDSEFVSKAAKPSKVPPAQSPTPAIAPKLSPMKSMKCKNLFSYLTTAPDKNCIGLQQCVLRRVRTTLMEKMYPTYEVYDSDGKLLMIAKKMKLGAVYNIYAIETESSGVDAALSPKKQEFQIGKLKGLTPDDYVLYNHEKDPTEILAVNLERIVVDSTTSKDYVPRKLKLAIPQVSKENKCLGNIVGKANDKNEPAGTSLVESVGVAMSNDKYKESEPIPCDPIVLKTKSPYLKEGRYYLNFHGRVKLGSLKNFQLIGNAQDVPAETKQYQDLTMQFGKTSSDDFSMDYKYPLTCIQALGIALTQFEI